VSPRRQIAKQIRQAHPPRGSSNEPASDSTHTVTPPKIGSVVVAIPAARLAEFAEAVLTSNLYLALSPTVMP
jgi:hypothetical protein